MLLTVAHSLSFGWKRGLITVAGATAGIAVQLLLAVVGLSTVLKSAASIFEWIRWGGVVYLIYLGVKQWISAGKSQDSESENRHSSAAEYGSRSRLFTQGLIVTIFNPKTLIFLAAFLPQFIDMQSSLLIQFTVIVPTFLIITFIITGVWAVLAGKSSEFLKGGKSLQFMLRGASVLMIAAGIGLMLSGHGA